MNETMAHFARSGPLVGMIRLVSFLLLFVGALLVMIIATVGGGCIGSTNCSGTSFLSNALTSIQAARLLFLLGFSGLILSSGMRLQYGLQPPAGARMEDIQYIMGERRLNGLLIMISIFWIMFVVYVPYLIFPYGGIP